MTARTALALRGFTLLEVAAVMAITGIVLAMAVPSYANFAARQQLRAAGETLALDLRMAREESLRGASVFISYRAGREWCWGISHGQPCDCSKGGVPVCSISRGVAADYPRVELRPGESLQFEPGMGRLLAAGQTELATSAGHRLSVQTNLMGRSHLCGPDAPKPTSC